MSTCIIKIEDEPHPWYLEWGSIVDAPVTYGLSLEEFREFYREEYGRSSLEGLEERLRRVEEKGTSSHLYASLEELIQSNRAGEGGSTLTLEEIREKYCRAPRRESEVTSGDDREYSPSRG